MLGFSHWLFYFLLPLAGSIRSGVAILLIKIKHLWVRPSRLGQDFRAESPPHCWFYLYALSNTTNVIWTLSLLSGCIWEPPISEALPPGWLHWFCFTGKDEVRTLGVRAQWSVSVIQFKNQSGSLWLCHPTFHKVEVPPFVRLSSGVTHAPLPDNEHLSTIFQVQG